MAEDTDNSQDVDVYAPPSEWTPKYIRFSVTKGIASITLNRPPANVLSIEMMEDLNRALESLEYQRDVKLVVLRGDGKYFSAGLEINDHLGDRGYVMLEAYRRIFENLAKTDKPTLAVVAGPALGAGSILAAACDITLAAQSVKLGHPEIKAGVFSTVAAALLPRLVGRKRAFEMLFGGATVTAAEAERMGLVTHAVADERLEVEAGMVIQRFSEMSAMVAQFTRSAIAGALDLPMAEAIRHAENVYLNQLMTSEDAAEGLKAVIEKRKPTWKDR
jgi:cyclohexa-1,5-dienecarbonyl-CoA hydratase